MGQTGAGKTTVCQMAALMLGQRLHIINCNQHTEASDFLGGFRPVRDRERHAAAMQEAASAVVGSPLWASSGRTSPPSPSGDGLQLHTSIQALAQAGQRLLEDLGEVEDGDVACLSAAIEAMMAAAKQVRAPFVWADGPLVTAMREGDCLLIDEINLADDAVLERLNSVLEPGRSLTLAEKGGESAEVSVPLSPFSPGSCLARDTD